MEINRTNYEVWLIDWLDGNLNDLQVKELKLFLDKNPDIKSESEELFTFSLEPASTTFQGKSNLRKTTADLTDSQFEYLCIAYLEKDISSEQEFELLEIIEHNKGKKEVFEIILKTKLTPRNLEYQDKNKLIKKTPSQKVISLYVTILSAAAAIALLVSIYILAPGTSSVINNGGLISVSIQPPEESTQPTANQSNKDETPSFSSLPPKKGKDLKPFLARKESADRSEPGKEIISQSDSGIIAETRGADLINNITVQTKIILNMSPSGNTLIAMNSKDIIPLFDEERSNVGRFIARNFRQKLLKEKTPQDAPLKGYEIAEAGVTGLNKLLGWEMALDKNNDENGELKSVYFSSKYLKFNAPVKKTEPMP